jgi:glycogen(starch) synthase
MRENGVFVVFGRWLIEGSPLVVLFDVNKSYGRMNEWKADLWNISG